MPRNYYITQPGRLRRKDNTLYLEPEGALTDTHPR